MCLRARKTKRYGQRVPIVSYYVGSSAAKGRPKRAKGRQIWPPPWAAQGPATPLVKTCAKLTRHRKLLIWEERRKEDLKKYHMKIPGKFCKLALTDYEVNNYNIQFSRRSKGERTGGKKLLSEIKLSDTNLTYGLF